ncbi:MAG: antirepressor regulating drug resistance protein [Planctomycetaceae bacterium]|nr:antirepressor regulating drug resistance protein [Planctomycetaceae bacterium]
MNAFLVLVLTNAVIATGMFAIVVACKSRIRNPAVLHWLWMLVLIKLLTPPLWNPQLAWLPASERAAVRFAETSAVPESDPIVSSTSQLSSHIETRPVQSVQPSVMLTNPRSDRVASNELPPTVWRRITTASVSPALLAVLVWGAGAVLLWGLSISRMTRLQRYLRLAVEAPVEIQEATALLAEQLGLRRCPRVWLVPGRVSPMLWALIGPARIIVPGELFSELGGAARQTLLLHELAHYRRGDHWVRWIELASLGFYWWHPVMWLLRREIRLAEELSCDACVVSQRPDDRRIYAEMLVNTVAFLSSTGVPSCATGVGTIRNLEGRVRSIMCSTTEVRVSRRIRFVVCLLAALLLPLAPVLVRAQHDEAKSTSRQGTATASNEPAEETKAAGKPEAATDDLIGVVVDEAGRTVADIEVAAFIDGQRVDRVIKTDAAGQFRIPKSWRRDDFRESSAMLLVRQKDTHLGWRYLGYPPKNSAAKEMEDAKGFRIVLLPLARTIRGRLVDPEGKPLSGIRVAVEALIYGKNYAVNQYYIGQEDLGTATTDGQGTFVIHVPLDTSGTLEPQHPDWQRIRIKLPPKTADLGRIALTPAGRIQGRVIDAVTGKPLAGQKIFAQGRDQMPAGQRLVNYGTATTGQDGQYILGGLSPGRFNVLFSGAPGSASPPELTAKAVEGVEVSVGQPVQADFQASTGRRLSGRVLDRETGKPLAKISVGYYGPARPNSGAACLMVRTKADGAFEFRVPPGESKVYVAEGNRRANSESTRIVEVPVDQDLENIVLQAGSRESATDTAVAVEAKVSETPQPRKGPGRVERKKYTLHVNLLTPQGRKTDNVTARVVFKGGQHTAQWTALSSTGNDVGFHPREEGRQTFLLIDADGYTFARSPEFIVREQMPDLNVQLVPEVRVPVRGRVVDEAGKGAAGARVRVARSYYGTEQEFPWGLEHATGSDGGFEVKHARQGDRIQVRIDKAGTGGAETDWLVLDSEEPRLLPDLRIGKPNQEVGGFVRDYDGFVVENAKVIHTGEPRVETTTDAEGKFRLTGLPIGTVSLTIESAGYPREVRSARTGKLDNEIRVKRENPKDNADYVATVTLRPSDGKEVSNATLYFCVENGNVLMSMPERKGNSHSIGFASFVRRNKDKQFAVLVAAHGYAMSKLVTVPNQRGPQKIVVDLEPAAPVTLRGRVIDADGRPVAEAKVGLSISITAQDTDEPWRYFGSWAKPPLTDAEGTFEIRGILRNSRVALYVNKAGYSGVWSARTTIEKSVDLQWPELRLTEATGELSGSVVDEQGRPAADATVGILDLGGIRTTTDKQGRFRLQKVPSREVLLFVRGESGEWTQKVTPNASDLSVKLKLRP